MGDGLRCGDEIGDGHAALLAGSECTLPSRVPTDGSITLKAYAKLNLALSVGPPVPPKGYHPIASWFAPIELHDDLTISRLDSGVASRHDIRWAADAPKPTPIDWPIEKDLAVRAHRLLESEADRPLPIAMTLEKRTPVGGGLGGGSSDAASALIGVNHVYKLGLSPANLRGLSQELGSDIAFFLDDPCVERRTMVPRSALVTGFGEKIERTHSPRGQVLLFFPPFGCPTGAVYKEFDAAPTKSVNELLVRSVINGETDGVVLCNDLGAPACAVEPRLLDLWDRLSGACPPLSTVHLTGSGSTLFAGVDPHNAWSIRDRCKKAAPEVVILETAFISP
jgi:4-diphosphocytidyl-2-C-methyl-D-erythritol kinase